MIKYVDAKVVFREVPEEITLAISISNCQVKCPGCHSSYLAEDVGKVLNSFSLLDLIRANLGITCVCFMGEGKDCYDLIPLIKTVREEFPDLKIAYYTGHNECPNELVELIDYLKTGPYVESLGPLTSETTNQRFYKVDNHKLVNLTYKFQHETKH
jgi:anaerobic ribonucleoside-triphosphate reductase activating protein